MYMHASISLGFVGIVQHLFGSEFHSLFIFIIIPTTLVLLLSLSVSTLLTCTQALKGVIGAKVVVVVIRS